MKGDTTVNLPLAPYLIKYLKKKYGDSYYVSRTTWLGAYVIDILDKEFRPSRATIKPTTFYPITVPFSVIRDVGFSMTLVKFIRLEVVINQVFLNDLYTYIEVSKDKELKVINPKYNSLIQQNIKTAISQFLDYYNISEDEKSEDNVYRQYNRDLKRLKTDTKVNKEKTKTLQVL